MFITHGYWNWLVLLIWYFTWIMFHVRKIQTMAIFYHRKKFKKLRITDWLPNLRFNRKTFYNKKITPNDVVLFKTNKSLHPTFDHYQIGLVKDTYEDFDKVSRKIDIKYFLSVEGNVREMSAKRMIRVVIFAEDFHHAANFHPLCCRILEPNYFLLH